MDPTPRGKESTPLEQAVSRAVRDNLALIQHTTKELSQAIEDFVAACGSSRNANMLPAMLRAQTASASLTSMLEVISRLLTTSMQPARAGASESYLASLSAAEAPAAEAPVPAHAAPEPVAPPPVEVPPPPPMPPVARIPEVAPEPVMAAPPAVFEPPPPPPPVAPPPEIVPPPPPPPVEAEPVVESHHGPLVPPETEPAPPRDFVPAGVDGGPLVPREPAVAVEPPPAPAPEPAVAAPAAVFRVEDLPAEQQELHRRANRHAKVSMQDIYLLRPKDVQLARQNKDICVRLRGDIEKARKEYVRRFGPILDHPVDYFYHWMVEVLAEGKPEILGEYPYPSAAARH
ncbi:MAG TPA: hypothetical protein VLW54_15440 [Candidatus Acidoferrales bacterium]|nr:hypothetical protein [Candidatus Acidoferrales bacterium]